MRTVALVFIASFSVGGSAYAAERGGAITAPEPHCMATTELRAHLKDAKLTELTPAQFHFAAGLFAMSPITVGVSLPPGNGALLEEGKGGRGGAIYWTRNEGKQVCTTPIVVDAEHGKALYLPMPITPEHLADMRSIKSGKDEKVMGTGGYDPDEMHL